MKKKIALLLTAIMVLSPLSAFAATDNLVEGTITTVRDKTVLMESSWKNKNGSVNGKDILGLGTFVNEDVERVVSGTELIIQSRNGNLKKGDTFDLVLDNAEWYFANGDNGTVTPASAQVTDSLEGELTNVPTQLPADFPSQWVYGPDITHLTYGRSALNNIYDASQNTKEFYPYFVNTVSNNIVGLIDIYGTSIKSSTIERDFKSGALDFINGETSSASTGKFTSSTFDRSRGSYSTASGHAYLRFGTLGGGGNEEIPYMMRFNYPADKTRATLTILRDSNGSVVNPDRLVIPLVTRLIGGGDAKVSVANSNHTNVTAATYTFASVSGTEGKTNTSVEGKDIVTARNTFELGAIMIKEEVIGTIQSGIFYLTAPYGFYFVDPEDRIGSGDKFVELSSIGGLKFDDGTTVGRSIIRNNQSVGSTGFHNPVTYDYSGTTTYKDKLRIDLTGGTNRFGVTNENFSSVAGAIYINNLILLAEDYAPFEKDVMLKISVDRKNDPNITPQEFKVGKRADWVINLRIAEGEEVPTLVNGRLGGTYDSSGNFSISRSDDFDGWNRAAKIVFEENVIASWWEERDTELTLPDGVKFIQVELLEAKDNVFDFGNKTYELNGVYEAAKEKGVRQGYVKINGNKVTLTDLKLRTDKKGYFEMISWVSIESGFEGDITLTAGGTGVPYDVPPVVIAKAVSPITIDTEVTDVKIGYQWQKVANFIINETGEGRLLRDKQLRFTIDDSISIDEIYFAPDSVVERSGNISFTKPSVNHGAIEMTIDRSSNGSASAIRFSNVYVKIDRTVPESNNHPYKLLASGSAIAANYVGNAKGNTSYSTYEPLFSTKGIGADYLNVVTAANDKPGVLSNTVRVTIGNDIVLVGRDNPVEIQMDTAPYISAQSNSTMVPVRFVSVALGIPDGQIIWDNENRAVTINYANTIAQMKAGSDQLTINGVTTTMYSPDVPPRKVTVEMKDNRAFLPFRQLGYALGVPVGWDDTTRTAIYNPPEEVNTTNNNSDSE